jgi:hypothetical protein
MVKKVSKMFEKIFGGPLPKRCDNQMKSKKTSNPSQVENPPKSLSMEKTNLKGGTLAEH